MHGAIHSWGIFRYPIEINAESVARRESGNLIHGCH